MALERMGSRSQKSAREVSRPMNSSLLLASALFSCFWDSNRGMSERVSE